MAVPTRTAFLPACTWPGSRSTADPAPLDRAHRTQLDPLPVEHRPGTRVGRARTDAAVDRDSRLGPDDLGVVDRDLRGEADPVRGLVPGLQRAVLDAVEGLHEQAGPTLGEALQQVAGRVAGADGLGHQAVRRTGVELLDDAERGRPAHLVTRPDGVLDRGGTAPRGQHREVQVHPAVLRDVQRRLRQQSAVGDHRTAVGTELAQRRLEVGVARVCRLQHRHAELLRAQPDRGGHQPAATTGRGIRSRDHTDELVPAGRDGLQRRNGDLGGAGEDQAHAA